MPSCEVTNPADALQERADALRALAEDVEVVADKPAAAASKGDWSCPHATDTRQALGAQKKIARGCAQSLRELAAQVDRRADRLSKEHMEKVRQEAK